jgi:hypothetical protein
MIEDTTLVEQREELKCQLAAAEHKWLFGAMLDGTGRFIQKLTRNPELPAFWYSALVIGLVYWLISLLTSILLGEFYTLRRDAIPLEIFGVGISLAIIIAGKIYTGSAFTTFRDHIVDAFESATDLADFQRWLAAFCNVKRHLFFSLAYGIVLGLYSPIAVATIRGGFPGFGFTILSVIFTSVVGGAIYYGLVFWTLLVRLSRYHFKLYAADPSSSEVIHHLSGVLTRFLYVAAMLGASGTLITAFLGLLTPAAIIILVLSIWSPLAAIFLTSQYALRKIITRAKWETLNEIQAEVERLQAEGKLTDKETMESANRLMDYHNRIKATRDSALDLRAALNFLNSLLLPLLAFLLANLGKVLEAFR